MQIEFDKAYLKELYESGKSSDKKHRYQPEVVRGYQKAVFALTTARCIEDLFPIKSLNYEALSGDCQGISSVRINRKYRLEFSIGNFGEAPIVTICRLLDISNHYN